MPEAGQAVQTSLELMAIMQNMAVVEEALEVVVLLGGLLVARLSMVLAVEQVEMAQAVEVFGAVSRTHIPHQ